MMRAPRHSSRSIPRQAAIMARLLTLLFVPLALGGCATNASLAEASGPYRALNVGRWQPTADDLGDAVQPAQSATINPAEARQ